MISPDAALGGAASIVEQLGLGAGLVHVPQSLPETPLQLEVRHVSLLVVYMAVQCGTAMINLRDMILGPRPPWNAGVLGAMAPDPVMQALVDLSAVPEQPAKPFPDPDAPDEDWAAVPTADLVSLDGASVARAVRSRADAELGRRTREARQRLPGLLLRHTGPLRRT